MAWIESHQGIERHPKFGPIKFNTEREIEDFIVFNWSRFFGFSFWCRQYRLNKKLRIDLLGNELEKKILYVIELKKVPFKTSHLKQLNNYISLLSEKDWTSDFTMRGILINYDGQYLSARLI